MRLKTRFLLVLAVSSAILVVAAVFSARFVLTSAAWRADEVRAQALLARGEAVLAERIRALSGTATDWASWDDTAVFLEDRNLRHLAANPVDGAFAGLGAHAIAYYDTNRRVVAAVSLDDAGQTTHAVPDDLRGVIADDDGVLDRARGGGVAGFVFGQTGVWQMAAAPILPGGAGPARGTLVLARRMDGAEEARLAKLIDPSFRLLRAAPNWPPGKTSFRASGLRSLEAGVAMSDLFGSGRVALEITVPRVAFGQVAAALSHLCVWIVVMGAGLCLLAGWLLDRWVLGGVIESIKALRHGIVSAGTPGSQPRRPPLMTRHDEIGELWDAVEAALAAVETSAREADRRRAEAVHSQRLAALGTLAAGVAHEINNPNGIVQLNAHVLRRELERLFARIGAGASDAADLDRVEKELGGVVAETLAASDRIAAIVGSLRSFTQPVPDLERERVAVADLLDDAGRWLCHEFRRSRCRLELALAPDLPTLTVRKPQLVQVFINLLLNASQAATRPDTVVRVSASHDRQEGNVTIAVADEGRGMPPEDVAHALDPFFTTRRSEGGTGLGLSISASIVRAHGGSLRIDSREGEGTTVTVVLPVPKGEDRHDG